MWGVGCKDARLRTKELAQKVGNHPQVTLNQVPEIQEFTRNKGLRMLLFHVLGSQRREKRELLKFIPYHRAFAMPCIPAIPKGFPCWETPKYTMRYFLVRPFLVQGEAVALTRTTKAGSFHRGRVWGC